MPTETDEKLAADLADFRVEVAERFGKLEAGIAERFGKAEAGIAERFGKVEAEIAAIGTELGLIRKLGDRILGAMLAGVGTMLIWAVLAAWYGSAVNSDVKQQGARIDKLEKRLDGIDQKLDTLISRTATKAGG